ncbi:MAG: hypothetical protein FWB78_02765 [Treponema sp.]|nr:hypothetical protein [Treponema sp.]
MPLFSRKTLDSSAFIFVVYVVIGCFAVLGFRMIFQGETPPLPILSRSWWRTLALLDIIALFPALALSALVLPFGMNKFQGEVRHSSTRFSADLFKRHFKVPIITAISASALYALLFFMVLPLAQYHERNMRFDGEIFRMARARALAHGEAGEWVQASQFIGISDSIWPESPYLRELRNEVAVNLEWARFFREERPVVIRPPTAVSHLPGHWEPVDTAEAMAMSQTAYDEGRLFDAHWLATVGRRLAPEGSPESVAAARLAARAWNLIESQRPTAAQIQTHRLFQFKMSGYYAMLAGDWVRAFYIFRELIDLVPDNPDVRNFLARTEQAIGDVAFFVDEMNVTIGDTITGAIFSLPVELGMWRGRAVLRLASFSSTPDVAFGIGLEYMLFDHQSRLMLHLYAPYAKFTPFSIGDGGRPQVLVLLRALDRNDPDGIWEPTIESIADGVVFPPSAQFLLNVSFEDFLMLARMRQDISSMHISELFDASRVSVETGYIPQVFQAEILNRLGSSLFFLPTAIAAIAVAWYFRTKRFPRYLFIPLLFVLPMVFNGIAYIIRAGLNVIGISLTMALGFPAALILFSLIMALAFVGSLFLLSAQRG